MREPTPGSSSERLHHGRKFDLVRLTVPGPSGRPITREVVRHPGAVVVLPLLEAPGQPVRVVLIRNLRPAVGQSLVELPAGTLEPGEPPDACAGRELVEETGFAAATLEPLGRFYTSPGLTDELMSAFVARGLTAVGQRLEDDEEIAVVPMPVPDALALVDSAQLVDGKSILALLLARRRGLI